MTDTTLQEPSSAARAGADVRIDLCTSRRGALREQHLTAAVETPVPAQGLAGVFEAVAARQAREGIEPIAEKVYGAAEAREAILAARREAFAARGLDASTPVTFVSGAPACGGLLAGIHVWGVAREGADRQVRTVSAGPVPAARLWSAAGFRLLGTHRHSAVIEDPQAPGNHVLRLVATDPTEHMHNHVEVTLAKNHRISNGQTYRVSLRARWLAGSPRLNTRLYFNRLARTTVLARPPRHFPRKRGFPSPR